MRPIIDDDIDEEEGLDTLSPLSPSSSPTTARPSLHGLNRELSTKFGTSVDNTSHDNDSSGQQRIMSYTDYLQAQKKMQSRRHLAGASAAQQLLRSLRSEDDGGDGGNGGGKTSPTADGAQQSMQTNLTVLAAAARLRRRAAKTAKEQKTLRALEAWGRRGSTVNLMTPDEAVQWDVIFRYVFIYIYLCGLLVLVLKVISHVYTICVLFVKFFSQSNGCN